MWSITPDLSGFQGRRDKPLEIKEKIWFTTEERSWLEAIPTACFFYISDSLWRFAPAYG